MSRYLLIETKGPLDGGDYVFELGRQLRAQRHDVTIDLLQDAVFTARKSFEGGTAPLARDFLNEIARSASSRLGRHLTREFDAHCRTLTRRRRAFLYKLQPGPQLLRPLSCNRGTSTPGWLPHHFRDGVSSRQALWSRSAP